MKQWLRKRLEQPDLLMPLIWGTGVALSLQVSGAGISYLSQVLLARWMGATEYGIYDYITTLGLLVGNLAALGLPSSLLRFIPEYRVKQDWGHLQGVIRGSLQYVIFASVSLAASGTLLAFWLHSEFSLMAAGLTQGAIAIILGIWLMPLFALLRLLLEMGRATGNLVVAYVPSLILWPLLLSSGIFLFSPTVTHIQVLAFSLGSLVISLVLQLGLLRLALPPECLSTTAIYSPRKWFAVSLPLLVINSAVLILNQTDIIMTGAFLGSFSVGIYAAVVKTASWVTFVLAAVNTVAAPMFAALHTQGDQMGLQKLVWACARWMFWPSLGIGLFLIVFSDVALGFFGEEFTAGRYSLIILVLAQLVNVGAGSVGYLMQMTGYQNQCVYVFGVSALLNIILNAIFIPRWGIIGAAIATALTMSLWNIWLHQLVIKNLGVRPSIIAALGLIR
ncbi:MAG: flippase [Gomphosphaeria aponina SAG 52.96 = DSM 107014]|uniref:Flippase n=1 Tax=Gomphosphaeria aponina SAG 52.96 = DSM 107014 TaxID=1521640 RepID=A0A941GM23_9CHRO|nr:flippase [Gomphosphaeria aponina SAG 52.96 = DSM 107014]